jgi:simple sugar transport system ATP-binding protein
MSSNVKIAAGAATADTPAALAVQMRGITKRFGALVANDAVDFDLASGEIHALLGENGAGKTTLMNMLFGLFAPDDGEIAIRGEAVQLGSPRDALARHVGMVHQHFMLVPDFSVAENVALGSRSPWDLRLRRADVEREVAEVAERFGMSLDPGQPVGELSIDVQQRVEILKLLYMGAEVLILDEPTAVLGPAEIARLFDTLRSLVQQGASVVIITHKLREVTSIADRVTVLRHGRVAARAAAGDFDEQQLALAMLGHELPAPPARSGAAPTGPPVLRVTDLRVAGDRQEHAVDGASLEIHAGEIVGLAGVEGNGQLELCQALSGLRPPTSGTIVLGDRDLTHGSPSDFDDAGVGVISEDRLKWDVVPDMTLAENLALPGVHSGRFTRCGMLRRGAIRRNAEQLLQEYDVRPPDPDAILGHLSGGNQQKVVVARECSSEPRALIASQPTRGLDVGASEFVFRRIVALRDAGCAVLFNSTDLDELLALADRVVVFYRGRVVLAAATADLQVGQIATAMAGGTV